MKKRQYLLDENIDTRIQKALLQHAPDMVVWCVGYSGAPPLETKDSDILIWCENRNFTLVTNNRASMPVHLREHLAAGRHIQGIFILKRNMAMKEIIGELILIWEASELSEYADEIHYLPIS